MDIDLISNLMGERGGRQIRVTRSPYDQSQHELCQTLAQMIWGDKGLVESLGHTWFMVMDPRFAAAEKAWYKKVKVTASSNNTTSGTMESGLMIVDDTGNLSSPRLMSLEHYAEILGESRHYIEVVKNIDWDAIVAKKGWPPTEDKHNDPRQVKNWSRNELLALIEQECPNYFTQKGEPNFLAETWVKMFQEDVLGLVLDYAPVSNIEQWVFINTGDVAPQTERADPDNPIAHAEIEYLDRALTYRAMLRGNVIKVLMKLGGPKLAEQAEGVQLTEFEKDEVLKEVLSQEYDKLYKALPLVLQILSQAKETPFEERENQQLGIFRRQAQTLSQRILSGEVKPLDLLDGDTKGLTEESLRFERIKHDENLITMFYILIQAEEMVKAYPGFQAIIDIVQPIIEKAEPFAAGEFEPLCDRIQTLADEAIKDADVCDNTPTV
jgi:hypothetical protein